jgi:hypothetical protein
MSNTVQGQPVGQLQHQAVIKTSQMSLRPGQEDQTRATPFQPKIVFGEGGQAG